LEHIVKHEYQLCGLESNLHFASLIHLIKFIMLLCFHWNNFCCTSHTHVFLLYNACHTTSILGFLPFFSSNLLTAYTTNQGINIFLAGFTNLLHL
ncbi:hypothetical protein ACJX0J_030993, partial [Zea mays]